MDVAELRTDSMIGRSVIVAENRAHRPNEFSREPAAGGSVQNVANLALAEVGLRRAPGVPSCPFCVGNESKTPPALYERFDADGAWQVRVVPNMFPAVSSEAGLEDSPAGGAGSTRPLEQTSCHLALPAAGVHEVIIESAQHVDRTSALSAAELHEVLESYRDRLRYWHDDRRFRYGFVFKNQGPNAGASIAHLHSQFIALPEVPPNVAAELQRAESDCRQQGSCAYCRLIERERSQGERIVLDGDGYIAFCPFASLQPYEVWLLPQAHETRFEQNLVRGATDRLAPALRALMERLERIVPDGAYNMLLRTAPWTADCDSFHWRLELIPRVNAFAGFEIGTGIHINPIAPERAAIQLRSS